MPCFGKQYYLKLAKEAHEPFRLKLAGMGQTDFYKWVDDEPRKQAQFKAVLQTAVNMHRNKIGNGINGKLPKEEYEAVHSAVLLELSWYGIDELYKETAMGKIVRLEAAVASVEESKWTTVEFAVKLKELTKFAKSCLQSRDAGVKAKSALEVERMILGRGYRWRGDRSVLEKEEPVYHPSDGTLPPRTILGGAFDQNRRRH